MVPVTPTFPLSKLPYLAWKNVLATMNPLDFITSSMCSQHFKRYLRVVFFHRSNELSLNIWDDRFVVYIMGRSTNFELVLDSLVDSCSLVLNHKKSATLFTCKSSALLLTANEWIKLLKELFNCGDLHLRFMDCRSVKLEFVQTAVKGLKILELNVARLNPHLTEIVENFVPTQILHLSPRPEQFTSLPYLKDLDKIYLMWFVNYEELLVLNSVQMTIWRSRVSTVQLNSYLKAWLAGSLAPKLEMLHIRYRKRDLSKNYESEIMNEIDYQLVEEEQVYRITGECWDRKFKNGYNLAKSDGKNVTICFETIVNPIIEVYVLVWP